MIELNVKTLDGKNRSFCVPDDITVKQFKEKIANSIDIGADTQRLIYQGRVLQDEKKLSRYDVNGKTIHVVARPPPSTQGPSSSTSTSSTSPGSSTTRDGNTFVLGSFTLPSDMVDPTQVQNITQQVITGMGDLGRNARVSTRSAGDGSSVDVHIHLGSVGPPEVQSASQMRVDQARRMIQQAVRTLDRLENPPSEENSRGSSPMETSATGGATASSSERSSPEGGAAQQGRRSSDSDNNNSTGSRPRSPQHPTPAALSELMNEVFALNRRLQPHLERYQTNLIDDPQYENDEARRNGQRLFNLVSEALHYVSHAYHSISDLMIDMHRAPPREVRAPPSVLSHAMPVQAQINVQGMPDAQPRSQSQGTSTSTTSTSAPRTTSTSTSQAPGGPRPGVRMGSTPMSSGGPTNVASTMFMEFSPNAVTINSVSAHVLPAEVSASFAANADSTSSTNRPAPPPPPPPASNTSQPSHPPGARPGAGPQHIRMQIPVQIPMMSGMAPGGPLPPGIPPEVMQNIFQMVSNQGFPGFPGPGGAPPPGANNSSAQRTTASSSATTSTSSSTNRPFGPPRSSAATSTQTGSARTSSNPNSRHGSPRTERRNQHAAYVIPGPPFAGIPGLGGFGPAGGPSVDPFLPCQSRHFLSERAQQAAAGQAGEAGLANMVSNLVSSWMNQQPNPHPPTSRASGSATNSTSTTTSTATSTAAGFANLFGAVPRQATGGATSSASTSGQGSSSATSGGTEPNFVTAFRQFLQEGQQQASGGGSTGSTTGQQSPGQDAAFTDEVFTQLVRGISNYVAQAALGRPTDTIAGFLNSLGEAYNINPTQGVLMDVLNVASQHLTFTDVMAIFYGQPTPLQALQAPLREMVGERILQGQPLSDTSVQQAVERLMDDISPEIDTACENVQGRDDIDFRATLQEFVRHHLQVAIRFVMNDSSTDRDYAQHLYTLCQRVIHEFIALGTHCLEGGEQALERFIEHQVRHISRDVNPMIQQWMVSIPVREMQRMLPEINVPSSDLQRYIRRRSDMEASPQSSGGSFMSAESVEAEDVMSVETNPPVASSNKESMEVDSSTDSGAAAAEGTLSPESYEELTKTLPPPPTADPQDEEAVRLGSEDWHQAVPPDWVPIIARDVRRQNREPPQGPFSDAYLHGMPAKRRKVMSERRPESELSDLRNIVPETLRRAVAAAGVEPRSSVDDLTQDASASASLHSAFEQQVCDSVRERINRDPDFTADKFPNAERFFKKGK